MPAYWLQGVCNHRKTAVKTGKSVRKLVLEQGIMTEKELEEVLDPYLMTEVGEERKEDEARKAC